MENTMNQGLGPVGMVDGHGIGAGVMNVFIFTNDAKAALDKTMSLIQGGHHRKEFMVGYRKFEEEDYTPMFPPGLECFRVS
jgi:hypothetical protein